MTKNILDLQKKKVGSIVWDGETTTLKTLNFKLKRVWDRLIVYERRAVKKADSVGYTLKLLKPTDSEYINWARDALAWEGYIVK